jgi:hypothetical protein
MPGGASMCFPEALSNSLSDLAPAEGEMCRFSSTDASTHSSHQVISDRLSERIDVERGNKVTVSLVREAAPGHG